MGKNENSAIDVRTKAATLEFLAGLCGSLGVKWAALMDVRAADTATSWANALRNLRICLDDAFTKKKNEAYATGLREQHDKKDANQDENQSHVQDCIADLAQQLSRVERQIGGSSESTFSWRVEAAEAWRQVQRSADDSGASVVSLRMDVEDLTAAVEGARQLWERRPPPREDEGGTDTVAILERVDECAEACLGLEAHVRSLAKSDGEDERRALLAHEAAVEEARGVLGDMRATLGDFTLERCEAERDTALAQETAARAMQEAVADLKDLLSRAREETRAAPAASEHAADVEGCLADLVSGMARLQQVVLHMDKSLEGTRAQLENGVAVDNAPSNGEEEAAERERRYRERIEELQRSYEEGHAWVAEQQAALLGQLEVLTRCVDDAADTRDSVMKEEISTWLQEESKRADERYTILAATCTQLEGVCMALSATSETLTRSAAALASPCAMIPETVAASAELEPEASEVPAASAAGEAAAMEFAGAPAASVHARGGAVQVTAPATDDPRILEVTAQLQQLHVLMEQDMAARRHWEVDVREHIDGLASLEAAPVGSITETGMLEQENEEHGEDVVGKEESEEDQMMRLLEEISASVSVLSANDEITLRQQIDALVADASRLTIAVAETKAGGVGTPGVPSTQGSGSADTAEVREPVANVHVLPAGDARGHDAGDEEVAAMRLQIAVLTKEGNELRNELALLEGSHAALEEEVGRLLVHGAGEVEGSSVSLDTRSGTRSDKPRSLSASHEHVSAWLTAAGAAPSSASATFGELSGHSSAHLDPQHAYVERRESRRRRHQRQLAGALMAASDTSVDDMDSSAASQLADVWRVEEKAVETLLWDAGALLRATEERDKSLAAMTDSKAVVDRDLIDSLSLFESMEGELLNALSDNDILRNQLQEAQSDLAETLKEENEELRAALHERVQELETLEEENKVLERRCDEFAVQLEEQFSELSDARVQLRDFAELRTVARRRNHDVKTLQAEVDDLLEANRILAEKLDVAELEEFALHEELREITSRRG